SVHRGRVDGRGSDAARRSGGGYRQRAARSETDRPSRDAGPGRTGGGAGSGGAAAQSAGPVGRNSAPLRSRFGGRFGEEARSHGLEIRKDGDLDFLSLCALVHRLDAGIIPFRKATECQIHVSGGEFNCAATLSDGFGLATGIATAMVDYPIGELIAERVRAMGVKPF